MQNVNENRGTGLIGVLTLIFVVLKLSGNITWSWWWVLSPMWIGGSLTMLLVVLIVTKTILSIRKMNKGE